MDVKGEIYCPKCKRKNYSRMVSSHLIHGAKFLSAMGAGTIVGLAKGTLGIRDGRGGFSVAKSIMTSGSYDYECKNCGCKFRAYYKNGYIYDIKAI